MNILDKIGIILCLKNDSYSKYVDKFINAVINEGRIIKIDYYYAYFKFRGNIYKIWIQNRYYADLFRCSILGEEEDTLLYKDLRPSRRTQIRFWEWVESSGFDIVNRPDNYEGNITKILECKRHADKEM